MVGKGVQSRARLAMPKNRTAAVGRNRFIAPLAAHHPLDVTGARTGVAVATENPGPAMDQWRNKAIALYALEPEAPITTSRLIP
jgi:hypothetical protein